VHDLTGLITTQTPAPKQYTSIAFTERLAAAGMAPRFGSVGDAFDNAPAESEIGLFRTEVIRPRSACKGLDGPRRRRTRRPGMGRLAQPPPAAHRLQMTCHRWGYSRSTTVNTQPDKRLESQRPESSNPPRVHYRLVWALRVGSDVSCERCEPLGWSGGAVGEGLQEFGGEFGRSGHAADVAAG
jgi:hypothetical protein